MWGWVAASSLLVAFVAASHVLTTDGLRWLKFLLLPFLLVARLWAPRQEIETEARENELADETPWIKWWAAGCAAMFFLGAIYVSRSPYRIEEEQIVDFIVISLVVVMGPLAYVGQRRRFRELGEQT